jgi:hypothetical protein
MKREIVRELERLALVMRQIDRVEAERDAVVKACDAGAGTDALAAEPEREAAMIGELNRLKGIGMNDARSWCGKRSGATSGIGAGSEGGAGWRRPRGRAARYCATKESPRRGRRCCGLK